MLELLALALAGVHFGVPLAYYAHLRRRWLPRPWNLKADPSHTPRVTIIVPTYNEAKLIRGNWTASASNNRFNTARGLERQDLRAKATSF